MSENVIQTSFASGELAPSIFARTDLAAYHTGLALCRNFFVDYRSGVSSRAGTKFVIQCLNSALDVMLVPFTYSTVTTYMLEFGNGYIRFMNQGAPVLETGFSISAISNASPATATVVGNNFVNGDWVFITGVQGMPLVNGRFYSVTVVGSTVTLYDVNGNAINTGNYPVYTGGGTISRVYKIVSPYASTDLFPNPLTNNPGLKFSQSASVMTITHPSYPPYTLTFVSPTNWTLAAANFTTLISAPSGLTLSIGGGTTPNITYAFIVTAVDAAGNESAASTALTQSGANIYTAAGSITLSWTAVTGAVSYNVYESEYVETVAGQAIPTGAAYGLVGSSTSASFASQSPQPDFSITPPVIQNPFASNNPGISCYFQQRAYYSASASLPTTFWGSQPGTYYNFNISSPTQDSDAITGTIVSLQVNAIKWMLPVSAGLAFGTANGAWILNAGGSGNATVAVTPVNATVTPQAYNGASDVQPLPINNDILYVQYKGAIVRDLKFNIYASTYTGSDISIRSNHLFFGYNIIQWCYAEEPFKTAWAVRNDGILLSLGYVVEQEIMGWAHSDTLGLFKSVATITESPLNPNIPGKVDAVYCIVQRFIGGQFVRFIERFAERNFTYGAEDHWGVDAGVQSTLPTPAANLVASTASGAVTFTASANVFNAGNVGSILRMGGGIATITAYVNPTQLIGNWTQNPTQVLPNSSPAIPSPVVSGQWSLTVPATVFAGLDYLNGQTVSILADGGVVQPQVVVNGQITLQNPATRVAAGLKFQGQGQTMPLDTGEPTIQGKRKKVAALNLILANSRGLKVGRTFQTLVGIKEMNPQVLLGNPIALVSGQERVIMDPLWDVPGQICFQLDDPLPATLLGIVPEIVVGDTK